MISVSPLTATTTPLILQKVHKEIVTHELSGPHFLKRHNGIMMNRLNLDLVQGQKPLRFHQKDLHLSSKDEQ